jgi:hypothetical protein
VKFKIAEILKREMVGRSSQESFAVLPLLKHSSASPKESRGRADPQNEIVSRLHRLASITRDGLVHYIDAVPGSQGAEIYVDWVP